MEMMPTLEQKVTTYVTLGKFEPQGRGVEEYRELNN